MKTAGGMEVVPEEAERRARGERGQHAGLVTVERERDDRERDARDRADASGKAVHPVGEVHDVHHRDHPEPGQNASARSPEVHRADERQRERLDAHVRGHRDRGGRDLARELHERRQVVQVVERADDRRQQRAAEDAAGLIVHRQEQHRGHEHPGEDREPAEARHGCVVKVAIAWQVDRAHAHRESSGERRRDQRDDGRHRERRDRLELVHPTVSVSSGRD